MKLNVLKLYQNRAVVYRKGNTIDVPEAEAAFLLADAPGCFDVVPPKRKMMDGPPADKAMKSRRVKRK